MGKKISFMDELELVCHIQRKLNQIMAGAIGGDDIAEKIANDMLAQFKREYGLTKRISQIRSKYLLDAHEFIDGYEVPRVLAEKLEKLKLRKGTVTEEILYF